MAFIDIEKAFDSGQASIVMQENKEGVGKPYVSAGGLYTEKA